MLKKCHNSVATTVPTPVFAAGLSHAICLALVKASVQLIQFTLNGVAPTGPQQSHGSIGAFALVSIGSGSVRDDAASRMVLATALSILLGWW